MKLILSLMADQFKTHLLPRLEQAVRSAGIALSAAAALAAARLVALYFLPLLSSSFAWIVVQLIVLLVWKLSHRRQADNHPPAAEETDLLNTALPAAPALEIPTWLDISPVAPEESDQNSKPSDIKKINKPPPDERTDRYKEEDQVIKKINKPPPPPPAESKEPPPAAAVEEARDEEDSMESTWRAIATSPARHPVRKSDNWERPPPPQAAVARDEEGSVEATWRAIATSPAREPIRKEMPPPLRRAAPRMKKSATFREGTAAAAERMEAVEEDDSMEATWRAITGGGASPARQPLRKSDTWEMPPPRAAAAEGAGRPEMRKSATFREGTGRAEAGWRGMEALVEGRDELLGRVEAFIQMHYDHLRLQRQESEQQRRFTTAAAAADIMANRAY